MRFAIIENGIVTNIILADQEFIDEFYPSSICVEDVQCSIGDMWNGKVFKSPT